MIFFKKVLFLGTAFGLSPFFNYSYASEAYKVQFNIDKDREKIVYIAESILKENAKQKNTPLIDLTINIGKEYPTKSYTDAKNNYCKININYTDEKPLLLSNFYDDIQFVLWHEIGHCMLGKNILFNDYINWSIKIKNSEELNQQIKKQTAIALKNSYSKNGETYFKVAPPVIVYHEIYADIYALNLWIKNNKNLYEIVNLAQKRVESFNKNPLSSLYASGFSIPTLLEYSNKSTLSIDDVEKISQQGFIEYLKVINENYLSKNLREE